MAIFVYRLISLPNSSVIIIDALAEMSVLRPRFLPTDALVPRSSLTVPQPPLRIGPLVREDAHGGLLHSCARLSLGR